MHLVDVVKAYFTKLAKGEKSQKTVVIGKQFADAIAAQRRHSEAIGDQCSPLASLSYSTNESCLWRWTDSPVDYGIQAVVVDFAELDDAERNSLRDSLTLDDFYTLLTFARRCALASLRCRDAGRIETAFTGLAMIELKRIDWRDLLTASALVRYAGQSLGLPVASLLSRAAQMAEPQTAKALFGDRATRIDLAQSCGYREVSTAEGNALFETGYEHFAPKADLIRLAFESALALDAKGYEISSVEVACDLPLIWLSANEDSPIAKIVQEFSGCVSIGGIPRADPVPNASGQSLLVFVAEATSEENAGAVAAAAEASSSPLRTQLGLASGQLCAVIIQRSWMADTPPLEDIRSLKRLRPVFERLLAS